VRLCLGVALSQIHTQLVGTPGHRELRQPARSDGYDVWHAIMASTADVFLTFDDRLADHVERIPGLDRFCVLRSLEELLAAAAGKAGAVATRPHFPEQGVTVPSNASAAFPSTLAGQTGSVLT
jgi:hypothetical protein